MADYIRTYQAGESIFKQGETGDAMFVIKRGTVEILTGGVLLETLEPGDFFGEMALIDHASRAADAVAKTDCELEAVEERNFMFRVQETPFFALKVMRVMTDRLRAANERLNA